MNEKTNDKNSREEFDQLDAEIYKTFIELGWVIPQTEDEVMISEKALQNIQIPSIPAGIKDSSPLIERLRKERTEREKEKNQASVFKGILAAAKAFGFSNFQLAEMTGLTVALVTKLDLGLIQNSKRIPVSVAQSIASVVHTTPKQLYDYWNLGPRFAHGAEYKATDTPEIIEGQDFFEAVRQDSSLSKERRAELLALEKEL